MRAKFINEMQHFERGTPPLKSMEIGIFSHRDFDNIEDAVSFLISVLPTIFGGKIPENLLMGGLGIGQSEASARYPCSYWNMDCDYRKMIDYIDDYITINNKNPKYTDFHKLLFLRLAQKGYETPYPVENYPEFFTIKY
jgi:hypothetical protein